MVCVTALKKLAMLSDLGDVLLFKWVCDTLSNIIRCKGCQIATFHTDTDKKGRNFLNF